MMTALTTMLTAFLGALWRRAIPWIGLLAGALLLLLGARRKGEQAGRRAAQQEQRQRTSDARQRMLEAGADRPRDRDDLLERLRQGGF